MPFGVRLLTALTVADGDGDGDRRVLRSPSPIPSPPAGCEFLCVQKKAISNKV